METNFSKRLVYLRKRNQLTQDELALRINVSRQAISKWERGEGSPDLQNITLLAEALNVSVDDLLGHKNHSDQEEFVPQTGNYFKKLLYKAKHTTNSEEAKKIKKYLLIGGAIGLSVGIIMVISGFMGFASGAFNSVNAGFEFDPYNPSTPELADPFNPIPFMFLFLSGGFIASVSVYLLIGGLSIVVAKATSNYLDTRDKCPKCNDPIDSDENVCSNCGYTIKKHTTCACGKENQLTDKFCRECGKALAH
ncbi:MAG: helix-turn-helix domain-containing protein [Candidatus Izemoplasmataceae bacterium]